jgi:hypothetical protein
MTAFKKAATEPPILLELVCEAKIGELLGKGAAGRYEASGVHFKGGYLYIVFDDAPNVLRLRPDWSTNGEAPTLIETHVRAAGYEDITYQPFEKRWYCLIEAAETKSGGFKPGIDEFDASFRFIGSHWLDFPVKRENKGIEGLSYLRYRDQDYILGLCEGNACKSGSAGREPGQGRIQVFRRTEGDWQHTGTIRLPESVLFEDYASLDFRDRYVTVVSQVSSALWVGRVRRAPTGLDDLFEDGGRTALFPRDPKGRIIYCNLEGVTWLPDRRLVVVSDKAKSDEQASRCRRKDQSIHIFKLPARG